MRRQRAGRLRVRLGRPGNPPARSGGEARPQRPCHLLRLRRYWEDRTGVRHDGNFCQNGLVSANRRAPGSQRNRIVYRYLHASPADLAAGTITVKSWFDEINPKDLVEGRWDILANGRVVASDPVPELNLAPRQQKTVALGLPALTAEPGVE